VTFQWPKHGRVDADFDNVFGVPASREGFNGRSMAGSMLTPANFGGMGTDFKFPDRHGFWGIGFR
jgi:hypothetical protein